MRRILPMNFVVLKFCGLWPPIEWPSGCWRLNVYWVYSWLVIAAVYTFCISETVHAFQFLDDLEEMANSMFMPLTMACAVCKAGNVLARRRDILRYMDVFNNENCRPTCDEEFKTIEKLDKGIKQTILWYLAMVGTAVGVLTTSSFVIDVPRKTLPFNAWIPFNYTSSALFWSAYLHQIFGHGFGAVVGTAYDILLCGLIGQVCGQLKVLQFRMQFMHRTIDDEVNDPKAWTVMLESPQQVEDRILKRVINQHRDIFYFAESINDVFSIVIFMQCAVSTFVLCISVYTLSQINHFTTQFIFIVAYTSCMLTQIFIYCWFGNQVILESVDIGNAVYAMDWTKLSVRTQKNLLIVMLRSREPIRITSGNVIILSLDTFIRLLKLSYSTFNLLQRTSEK